MDIHTLRRSIIILRAASFRIQPKTSPLYWHSFGVELYVSKIKKLHTEASASRPNK